MKARIGPGDKLLSFVQNQYRKLDSKQHRIVLIVEEMDAKFFKRDLKYLATFVRNLCNWGHTKITQSGHAESEQKL